MRTYNHSAFKRSLILEGQKYNFYKYNRTDPIEYDSDTQEPINLGEIIQYYADVLDFTTSDIENSGGLIDVNSKKFVVPFDCDLSIGDEVLDSNYLQIYNIVDIQIFANRIWLFVNKVKDNQIQH